MIELGVSASVNVRGPLTVSPEAVFCALSCKYQNVSIIFANCQYMITVIDSQYAPCIVRHRSYVSYGLARRRRTR